MNIKMATQAEIQQKHRELQLTYKDYLRMQKNLENSRIDKYYILEQIGQGAFAQVYKGIDSETKKQVAIKVLNIRNIDSQKNLRVKKIRKRLVQEQSKIMMKFNSPHILKCYECFENKDLKIMVIQYCNQGSLQDKIDNMKKIPQTEAIAILKQIINGIGQCHKQKIIHRDLKADNILIHNGECKIADFGFSKTLDITNQNDLTMNTILGTMTTMAPQVMKREAYGLKADIWSIGVIFFQMLFGECPFKSDNSLELVAEIMRNQLMSKQQFNGVKPSAKVRKFLKQVLVVDIKRRLGWKQLTQHQLFKIQDQNLPQDFHRQVYMNEVDEQLLQMERHFIQQNLPSVSQKQQQKVDDTKEYSVFSDLEEYKPVQSTTTKERSKQNNLEKQKEQKKTQKKADLPDKEQETPKNVLNSHFRKVNPSELNQIKKQVNNQEQQIYNWAKRIHIECLKTECIFKNIIQVIQKFELFDMKNREVIEMMYLICTRCLNNISPITHEYQKRKNNQIIKDLHQTVSKLYQQVTKKWQFYSLMLTKKQNQKKTIVADFFSKTFSKDKIKLKDRYLTGIQSMVEFRPQQAQQKKIIQMKESKIREDDLLDYDKNEQIDYTYNTYISQNIKNLKFNQKAISAKQIRNYMKHYKDICRIEAQDLKDRSFKDYLKLLLM